MSIDEMKDRIARAEEIQRYTENRCEALEKENTKAKEIMQKLITNAPNTYSGTDIELQQRKMFAFQDAVNKAEQFLKETEWIKN